jgi:predicted nuclease of predicted toxin-antitoxin system
MPPTSSGSGLGGASDPEVLARAAAEDRILITVDTDVAVFLWAREIAADPGS